MTLSLPRYLTLALVAIGIVGGLLAWWASQRYLALQAQALQRDVAARYAPTDVLVARERLDAGTELRAQMLARRAVPADYAPRRALRPAAHAALGGRRLRAPLERGDVLTEDLLAPSRPATLATLITAGHRALTIPVDDIAAHGGLVQPEDRVDIYVAAERGNRIELLLQVVRVLAAGRTLGHSADGEPISVNTLTLEVTPSSAAQLLRAAREGELLALLRRSGDEALQPEIFAAGSAIGNRAARSGYELWVGGNGGPTAQRRWVSLAEPLP